MTDRLGGAGIEANPTPLDAEFGSASFASAEFLAQMAGPGGRPGLGRQGNRWAPALVNRRGAERPCGSPELVGQLGELQRTSADVRDSVRDELAAGERIDPDWAEMVGRADAASGEDRHGGGDRKARIGNREALDPEIGKPERAAENVEADQYEDADRRRDRVDRQSEAAVSR